MLLGLFKNYKIFMNNPRLNAQIWILAGGRLLLQFGNGFTLFYAPIFFVNQLGFSPTSVGIAIGSASVSGIFGRFWGGSWSDSPQWGRKKTLLLSSLISAVADIFLVATYNFPFLLLGNLLMGLGIGLYWPPAEAIVADLATPEQRNLAFAITRLADNIGLGLGVAIGGILISITGNYRLLFILDGISFIIFYAVIKIAINETYTLINQSSIPWQGWITAFKDSSLWIFSIVNILFTIYISQLQTTLPLYLTNFAVSEEFTITSISGLFSLHIALAALFQLPVVKILNYFNRIQGLTLSLLIWAICFILIWMTGNTVDNALWWGILAIFLGAIATITYNPSASGLIVDLAPNSLRGIYFAINSQCWAIGYLIGPPLGGWVLDQGDNYPHNFWLILALSVLLGMLNLWWLQINMKQRQKAKGKGQKEL